MKIIIYEDDDKLRQSLALLIEGTSDCTVVGAFPNCSRVEEEVSQLQPDIVLMDIDMPQVDGIEGVRRIKAKNTAVKVLMHTIFDDNKKLFACLQAGADGYLLKKASPIQLLEALKDIYTGGAPMSPGIARQVLTTFHKNPTNNYALTKRELEILQLLTEGYTYKAIADRCSISMDTVSTHLRNIYKKLHVSGGPAAAAKAIREGLVD
ncbi:MAG: response regulator transcription factor [Bacteroidota bacterium]